jgi:nitroimidazol reductase NimA-like FMN-containing flavoprotein (pyridoxamine 5'-phosphate oxidase superfamily)
MTDHDEPVLKRETGAPDSDPTLPEVIRRLVDGQPYGVLCTQGSGQPYGSVIAYAMAPGLRTAVFATARETRKYRLLSEGDRVALVIDSRSRNPGQLMTVEAVTATGRARECTDAESEDLLEMLIARHPYLREFTASPTTALVRVDIVRYLHVARFQEVRQWIPTNPA